MYRKLYGYKEIVPHEFKGEELSKVLSEIALYCASKEHLFHEFHLQQSWDEIDGYIIYVFEMWS